MVLESIWSFPDDSDVKTLPAMQETWIQSLGWEDPQEKEMATHSTFLAWRIPWTEEPGGYGPQCHKESEMTEWLTHTWGSKQKVTHTYNSKILLLCNILLSIITLQQLIFQFLKWVIQPKTALSCLRWRLLHLATGMGAIHQMKHFLITWVRRYLENS